MNLPTSYRVCSSCFTVFDSENDTCACPAFTLPGASLNWGRYRLFDPSLPVFPEVGKSYPLPDVLSCNRDFALVALALDEDQLDDYYHSCV